MTESLFSFNEPVVNQPVITDSDVFSRLVYLLESKHYELPNWLKYKLPFNDFDKPVVLWSPILKAAHRKGSVYGEGSLEEFKQCLDRVIQPELKTYTERVNFYTYLSSLAEGLFDENEETLFEDIEEGKRIEKFDSGFEPFDQAVKGFYESIITIAGEPGAGKTSVLLNFMSCLSQKYQTWYFQSEIPSDLIKQRISLIKPKEIVKGSKIFCGNYSSSEILQRVKKDPNPNRVIIYDSPEINNEEDEVKYFKAVYQDLVVIKRNSKLVAVTSQIKQGVTWDQLGIYSLSASASKARYTDILIYIGRMYDTLLVKTAKNRFGQLGNAMAEYDYETLQVKDKLMTGIF